MLRGRFIVWLAGLVAVVFLLLPVSGGFAQEVSADDAIYDFKQNYVPTEYSAEPDFYFYTDVVILAFVMLLAVVLMGWKPLGRWRRLIAWLPAVSLIYFGILRGGCICPVGATANTALGLLNPELVGWTTIAIFLLPLFFALIWGRIFCTAGCPLGAVQDLLYNRKDFFRLPQWLRSAGIISATAILAATIWYALKGLCFFVCHIDPYRSIFHLGYAWVRRAGAIFNGDSFEHVFLLAGSLSMWLYLAFMLLLGSRIPRVFCRFVCPYGILLGLFSLVSFRPRKIDTGKCLYCTKCAQVCPVQAITIDRASGVAVVSGFACIQCDRCSDACSCEAV